MSATGASSARPSVWSNDRLTCHQVWTRNARTVSGQCLFCKIVDRALPADVAYEDDEKLVGCDVGPQSPAHLLGRRQRRAPG
jgi:hypothetical protein